MLEDRTVEVKWNDNSNNKKYMTLLLIHSKTNDNKMIDIIEKANMTAVVIDEVKNLYQTKSITYEVKCFVNSIKQLDKFISALRKEPFVDSVERLMR